MKIRCRHSFIFLLGLYFLTFNLRSQDIPESMNVNYHQMDSMDLHRHLDTLNEVYHQVQYDVALFEYIKLLEVQEELDLSIDHKLRINDGFALVVSRIKAFDIGITHTQITLDLVLKSKNYLPSDVRWRYGRIGTFFIQNNQYDSAAYYFREAIPWAKKENDNVYLASAYNNLGIAFSKMAEYDSAYYYYELSKNTLDYNGFADSNFVTSVNDNLAELYMRNQQTERAYEMYKWNYEFRLERIDPGSKRELRPRKLLYSGLKLAETYLVLSRIDDLIKLVETLEPIALQLNDADGKLKLVRYRKEYYRMTGDLQKAFHYAGLEVNLINQISKDFEKSSQAFSRQLSSYRLTQVRKNLELEKLNRQSKEDQLKIATQRATLNGVWIVAIIIISVMSIVFLILNQRKQIRQRKLEREKLDIELRLKKKDLEDFAMDLNRKQEWTAEISGRLADIKKLQPESYSLAIQKLLNEIKNEQASEKRKRVFQNNVEEINHQFYERLNESYPNLTKTERELAGLFRIGLSNKEIAELRNTEVSSVKKGRNRLRKKLEIGPEVEIYSFIKTI